MRRTLLTTLIAMVLILSACSLGAPARPEVPLPTNAATRAEQPAAATPTQLPQPSPSATQTRAAPAVTPTPTLTAASVPAALERRDLAVISPANAARLELVTAFRPGPDMAVIQALFFPDNSRYVFGLASTSEEEASTRSVPVYIWNLASALPEQILDSASRQLTGLVLSPDVSSLAAAGAAGASQARLWDTLSWQPLPAPPEAKSAPAALAYDPRGGRLAIGYQDGQLISWELGAPVEAWSVRAHEGGVSALAASPDGAWLATAGFDGALVLWDSATGEDERTFTTSAGAVTALSFTPDSQSLLVYDKSGKLRDWRVSDGKLTAEFAGCSSGLPGCIQPAFSPDRRLMALSDPANPDGPGVGLWDLTTHSLLMRVQTGPLLDPLRISSLAFSPNGRLLAVGSEDGQVELWGVTGGLFTSGAQLKVTDPGDGLNLRDRPALFGSIRSQLRKGETVSLVEGPVVAGEFNWWRVLTGEGREGWIVEVPEWYEKGE